jgi:hypothetical protein
MSLNVERRSHTNGLGIVSSLVLVFCARLATGQATVSEVTGKTPVNTVAALAWKAVLTECSVPQSSSHSVFFLEVTNRRTPDLYSSKQLWEFRGAVITPPQQSPQSEADRLNNEQKGVQWRGSAYLKASAFRSKSFAAPSGGGTGGSDSDWTEFKNGGGLGLGLMKINDKWVLYVGALLTVGTGQLVSVGGDDVEDVVKDVMPCEKATAADPFADIAHALGLDRNR